MENNYIMHTRLSSFDHDRKLRIKPSSILKYMQETAERHLEDGGGYSYEYLASRGAVFLLSKLAVKINGEISGSDIFSVETCFCGTKGPYFIRNMRFFKKDQNAVILAKTHWILVDPVYHKVLRPCSLPFPLPQPAEEADWSFNIGRIPVSVEKGNEIVREIRWSDTDCNRHLNNSVYADLICDYFPGGMGDNEIEYFEIHFQGEALEGDNIKIASSLLQDGTAVISGKIEDRNCFESLISVKNNIA